MGNEGLHRVGKGIRKGTLKKLQAKSFAGYSQLGLSHEVTYEIQPGKESSNSSMCFSYSLSRVGTHEPIAI